MLTSNRSTANIVRFERRIPVALIALALLVYAASVGKAVAAGSREHASVHRHYLLLVNTAIAFMMNGQKLRQFDQSPYDGLAVAFLHAYDTSPIPSVASMDAQMKQWREFTHKDIWPWIYINRMLGMNVKENNPHSNVPYFRQIAGADLDDARGARTAFLSIWSNSLATARDAKVPGVFFDAEFYNNYAEYNIGEMARETGKEPAEVAASFESLGKQMADIAEDKYPGATIWFAGTFLTHPGYKAYSGRPYYPTPAYLAIGLLDEIAQRKMGLTVLAGGEASLGYCHATLGEFQSVIAKRDSDLRSQMDRYAGILKMAGTMTVWSDRSANHVCDDVTANSIEDLEPYIELMMKSYDYGWIWGSADGNYLAFSPASAPRFDAAIRTAISRAWGN